MKFASVGPMVAGALRLAIKVEGGGPLSKYFSRVLAAHIFLFFAAYLSFFLGHKVFFWKTKSLKVIQSSIKVDVVGMPKWTLRELKQMEMGNIKKDMGHSSKKVDKEIPESQSSSLFFNKIKQFSRKKIKVKRSASTARKDKIREKKLGKLILAGNKLSSGASLTGDTNSKELSELRLYMESLPLFIRPHWILPSYLKEKELQCRIRIFIAKGGRLLKATVVESSGDTQYDNHALGAIRRAQLPVPKDELLEALVQGVVVLGFSIITLKDEVLFDRFLFYFCCKLRRFSGRFVYYRRGRGRNC